MKKTYSLFILIFIFNIGYSQLFPQFLKEKGIDIIAKCAHIGTAYKVEESSYTLYHGEIYFDIRYEGGFQTILKVNLKDGIMRSTEIQHETHWFPTFGSISVLTAAFGVPPEEINDNTLKQVLAYYQNLYQKTFFQFNGTELTTLVLSYNWAAYAKEKLGQTSEKEPFSAENHTEQIVDGIKVRGNRTFVDRIVKALELIKEKDSYMYENFFAHNDNKYNLVRGIILGEPIRSYSTIRNDGYLDMANVHSQINADFSQSNVFLLAATLIHEAGHLYQFYEYKKLFDCNKKVFLESFSYDPVQFAKFESQAHQAALTFLDKLPKPEDGGNPLIQKARDHFKQQINDYELLRDGGIFVFENNSPQPRCGNDCLRLACEKFAAFGRLNDTQQAKYYQSIYGCN